MNLKKIVILSLSLVTLLTNVVTVEAKVKPKTFPPIFHTFDKTKFARGTGKYSKVRAILQEVDYSSQFPFTALNCADGDETTKYYARKDTVKVTTSKADKFGYMNTTFTVKIGNRVFNEYDETVSNSVADIYDVESRDNFGYADIIVYHQAFDRTTGINLMSGTEDYTDAKTGLELKNACVFKANGKKWAVQATAEKREPSEGYPAGSIVFNVYHPATYKGTVFTQMMASSSSRTASGVDRHSVIASLDYSKKFTMQGNKLMVYGDFWHYKDGWKYMEWWNLIGNTYYTASGK
jgi:hypothetical protein